MLFIFSVLLAIAITAFICFVYFLIIIDRTIGKISAALGMTSAELERKILAYHNSTNQPPTADTIVVSIEKHSDIYYAFNTSTDNFISQHDSVDMLKEYILKKYPTAKFR